jgi:hypothetical protein
MANIRGKIVNPVSTTADFIGETEAPVNLNIGTDMNYQATSLSTFLKTNIASFLLTDLSNVDNIFLITKPIKYGQSIFRNRLTEKTIPINLNGNVSEDAKLQTTIYTITVPAGFKCVPGAYCETFFTYEDEFGNIINDSVVSNSQLTGSIEFCSSSPPVITSTVNNHCISCSPPTIVVDSTKCNILDPSIDANNQILYIDNGRKYQLLSSRNESNNYGWEPVSNRAKYNHVERSDFDSFDFPQVTIRGVRKIPATTADTLCGPVTYTGDTYDRMNYNWFFGKNSGISFNPIQSGGTPVILSGAMESQEGVASISNKDGKILFYTNGETIYTSGNTIMSNGTGLSSSGTSTQSVVILPKIQSNKYYLFTTDYNGSPNGFEYSIVNMDLQDGNGEVETKNIKLINDPLTEKVTACSHSDGESYWVVTHTSGDTNYYSYRLSSAGLTGPTTTSIGSTHNTARGYMKTSPDCSKLISLLYDEDIIDIFDFDATDGTLSNFLTITGMTFDVGPYGLEFSSDSSKFYVSEGAGDKVYQFDLTYTSSTEILDNVIEVANINSSNFGALQMGPDERIYLADYNNNNLHIIHRPNGLGVQCNFQKNGITLTSDTITGTTSYWGLPNVITDKSVSCDRSVYIPPNSEGGYNFDLLINNVNNVIQPKKLSCFGEIYKYNQTTEQFSTSSLTNYSFPYESISGNVTDNTILIQNQNIGEGEFLIKTYWGYNVNTLMAKQEKVRIDNILTYKRGELYGLYVPETDWYFISIFEASKPTYNNSNSPTPNGINNLVVSSTLTSSGKTNYSIRGLSQPIVSYNGSILANNIEYSAITSGSNRTIVLSFTPLDNQILTYAYVENGGTDDILPDLYIVESTIKSGATNTQLPSDRVFYNTTKNKYEFYIISESVSDVVMSVNGSLLSPNIDYYRSTTNQRRIIFDKPIFPNDVIEAFYQPRANVTGEIKTNNPRISWTIETEPLTTNGKFTIEFSDGDDKEFNNILYSFEVDYVVGKRTYGENVLLTNAKAGDTFNYRVKNEKFYTPIMGETIYSVNYSDINFIKIMVNSGETY